MNILICKSTDYRLQFENEKLISRCKEYPNKFIDKLLDANQLNFKTYDNYSIHVKGLVKIVRNVPFGTKLSIETFKKQRGQWLPTVYNIYRSDLCLAAFSSQEPWHVMSDNLPPEQKACPAKKNTILRVNSLSNIVIKDLPSKNLAGDYKITMTATSPTDPTDLLCGDIFATAIRMN
ncbi:uncharacterized protein LOC119666625 [Teleopsis dalmanni]|uniref:uncharacterized protein LOC119666625 n=1 Tax=Teleopsis dalmanni TaxID=139649 RepID=UPI0018CE2575|nr:uncharacterized protein LOC119666625 [Teleopsis dalmanni]